MALLRRRSDGVLFLVAAVHFESGPPNITAKVNVVVMLMVMTRVMVVLMVMITMTEIVSSYSFVFMGLPRHQVLCRAAQVQALLGEFRLPTLVLTANDPKSLFLNIKSEPAAKTCP